MSVISVFMTLALLTQAATALERAGQSAEDFWDQFTLVQCLERVTQTSIQPGTKGVSSRISEFDYVAFLAVKASGIAVQESRVPRADVPPPEDTNQFLLTSGFPALLLMFHPDVRRKFEFSESRAPDSPAGTVRIAFKSKPGEQSLSAIKLKDRFFPIDWEGFAWIEEKTGKVIRIDAKLAQPMEDIGLAELRAEVDYKMMPLPNSTESYQLPARVIVSLRTAKRQWRNVHDYSGYKLFTVTTSTRAEPGVR
ncbi:MAG TPA: hypothetical protein VFR18_13275 [Terriglobia bacterium]|nr:hypothetical protein [Terriglobia bacterium]